MKTRVAKSKMAAYEILLSQLTPKWQRNSDGYTNVLKIHLLSKTSVKDVRPNRKTPELENPKRRHLN